MFTFFSEIIADNFHTSSGFPCLCCPKYLKNAKTLKEHLKKKQLPCLFVYDSVAIESQSHSRESLSLNVEPDSTSNTVATSKTTSFVNTSKESTLIESAAPNVSTASTVMTSPPTSSTLFSSNVFDELSFSPPPIEYRLFFNRIDVSAQFYQFQLDVQNRLRVYAAFTIEEHMQHLLVSGTGSGTSLNITFDGYIKKHEVHTNNYTQAIVTHTR